MLLYTPSSQQKSKLYFLAQSTILTTTNIFFYKYLLLQVYAPRPGAHKGLFKYEQLILNPIFTNDDVFLPFKRKVKIL